MSPIYADALARRGVVNIGAPFMSREWLSQRRPYTWSQFTDCSTIVESVGSYYAIKMANRPADNAGGSLKGQPRKVGIIAPENSWYQECVAAGVRILNSAGVQPVLNEKYRLEVNQMSIQAGEKLAKLKNAGVTTVVCGCDPLFMTFLTAKAKEQNYTPEWLVTGVALIDNDLIGSIMEPGQWSHAFGVSFSGPPQPAGGSLGYRAYKAVRKDEPSIGVDLIYNQLQLLAIGIQMAGPNLTPASFEQGMFRYPTRTGPSGHVGVQGRRLLDLRRRPRGGLEPAWHLGADPQPRHLRGPQRRQALPHRQVAGRRPPGGRVRSPATVLPRSRPARWALAVVLAGVTWALAAAVLPNGAPFGLVAIGAVLGSATGLAAVGIILVWRANRVVELRRGRDRRRRGAGVPEPLPHLGLAVRGRDRVRAGGRCAARRARRADGHPPLRTGTPARAHRRDHRPRAAARRARARHPQVRLRRRVAHPRGVRDTR